MQNSRLNLFLLILISATMTIFLTGSATFAVDPPPPSSADELLPALETQPAISDTEAKKLRVDFKKALRFQMKTLDEGQSRDRKENEAARKKRLKDWNKQEQDLRRKFFDVNKHGAERRVYILDFLKRRTELTNAIKDEDRKERESQRHSRLELDQLQRTKQAEFEKFLKNGRRPPESLWPPL